MTACDDASVADEDRFLRFAAADQNHLLWNDDEHRWEPTPAAYKFDPDGISGYLGSGLAGLSLAAADIRRNDAQVVFEFPVGVPRAAGFGVRRDPLEPPQRREDSAHALITYDPERTQKERRTARLLLLSEARLVAGEAPPAPASADG